MNVPNMNILGPLILYLRRLISYYVLGRTGSLSDFVRLEAGLYHDLKGIYTKRLGLPINKYASSLVDDLIGQKILDGSREVIRKFISERAELFRILPPNIQLVTLFGLIDELDDGIQRRNVNQCVKILKSVKDTSDSIYSRYIQTQHFELSALIRQVASDLEPSKMITVTLSVFNYKHSFKLPYTDLNSWRRIFQNLIINSIEACELKGTKADIFIRASYPNKSKVVIEIQDTGIGMDHHTLENFCKRGFTHGKSSGQGLGINEEILSFITSRGDFAVKSVQGKGTTITIIIDSTKSVGTISRTSLISPVIYRRLRLALLLLVFMAAGISSLAAFFDPVRFWVPPSIVEIYPIEKSPNIPDIYSGLIAKGVGGKELCRIDFDTNQCIAIGMRLGRYGEPLIIDADNDGKNDLIFGTSTVFNDLDNKIDNSYVAGYNGHGQELWKTAVGPDPPRAIFNYGIGDEGPFRTQFYGTQGVYIKNEFVIPVIAPCLWSPTQVLLLDKAGQKLREYWHPGHLNLAPPILDFDKDGDLEFVFYGINDGMGGSPSIAVLSYDSFEGQSIPYTDKIWPKAHEKKYYLFGRAWKDGAAGTVQFRSHFSEPYLVWDTNGNKFFTGLTFISEDGRTIRLDNNLDLDTIIIDTVMFSNWWKGLGQKNGGNTKWTKADLDQLYGYQKYVNGVLVADSIFKNVNKYKWRKQIN